jgi:hypothetical protein
MKAIQVHSLQKDIKEYNRPVKEGLMTGPENNKRRRTYLEVSFWHRTIPGHADTRQKKQTEEEEP